MGSIIQFKRKQAKTEPQDVNSFGYGDALIDWSKALDGMRADDTAPSECAPADVETYWKRLCD